VGGSGRDIRRMISHARGELIIRKVSGPIRRRYRPDDQLSRRST